MPYKRVVVYTMHEYERHEALQALGASAGGEGAVLTGELDDTDIERLRERGLIVSVLEPVAAKDRKRGRPRVIGALGMHKFPPRLPGTYWFPLAGPLLAGVRHAIDLLGARIVERGDRGLKLLVPSGPVMTALKALQLGGDPEYDDDDERPTAIAVRAMHGLEGSSVSGVAGAVYDVVLRSGADPDAVTKALAEGEIKVLYTGRRKLRVVASVDQAEEVAARPDVSAVEAFVRPRLYNDRARELTGVDAAQSPGLAQGPLTGDGVLVGVADTGLDQKHATFAGRILECAALGRPGDPSDVHGHGTHVTGTILGTGEGLGGKYRGMAPGAQVYFQSVADAEGELGGIPVDTYDLFKEPYDRGVRIHNNSWGADLHAAYPSMSNEVDEFVADHRDMLIVIAAGNAGTCQGPELGSRMSHAGMVDWYSVGAPATSKNALVVGAARSDRQSGGLSTMTYGEVWSDDFGEEPMKCQKISGDPECLAGFSSRGPSDDARVKPDVVAPGTDIASARSSDARASNFDGVLPGTNRTYAFMSGTSMATPVVSGIAALVREYLAKHRACKEPSAALMKALLINGARRLKGNDAVADFEDNDGGPDVPNIHQGFGVVDLRRSIPLDDGFVLAFDDRWIRPGAPYKGLAATGDVDRFRFRTTKEAPLSLTLAWTDVPGRGVQNNLDLFLELPYRGGKVEKRIGNASLFGALRQASPDRSNNVEVIRIDSAPAGDYVVQVTASNLLHPGQDFALVVAGALASPDLES